MDSLPFDPLHPLWLPVLPISDRSLYRSSLFYVVGLFLVFIGFVWFQTPHVRVGIFGVLCLTYLTLCNTFKTHMCCRDSDYVTISSIIVFLNYYCDAVANVAEMF